MADHATLSTPKTDGALTGERADLLAEIAQARYFLRFTVRELSDEQLALRPTSSELCLGGLIKHVTAVERGWVDFIVQGRSAMKDFDDMTEEDWTRRADEFQMLPGDTLADILAAYAEVAARTDEIVATTPDLNAVRELPTAPWNQDTHWTVRRALLHIVAETAQHAGHADIIREAIDGAKTMG
ncbi:DinB family protein [Nocardia sp. CA2R105]|uniref:DinB family protein n=1 Tax=Nocardia coffeae TaxID=2873381 RepID=UPI001CA61E80|nr:DinB family protein [Nocardia coffeae]MBY8861032.1 DinB family protein [Nocardia coffeae]